MIQPFALFIRASRDAAFEIADSLGFENEMAALAVSIFEDGPETMHVQALFETEDAAKSCLASIDVSAAKEAFITQLPDEDWVAKSQSGLPLFAQDGSLSMALMMPPKFPKMQSFLSC